MKTLCSIIISVLVLCGCNSTNVTENPTLEKRLNRVDVLTQVNINNMASNLVSSLKSKFSAEGKPKLAFGRFVNDTSTTFDSNTLLGKVRTQIIRNNLFEIVQMARPGGTQVDPVAASVIQRQAFIENKVEPNLPEYVLYGKVSENRLKLGNVFEYTYNFHFSLVSKKGTTVWEFDEDLVKQASRPDYSF
jgi:PBP1b-binding outer membrane lipoprotein LpoB